jgi:hypothetical protein
MDQDNNNIDVTLLVWGIIIYVFILHPKFNRLLPHPFYILHYYIVPFAMIFIIGGIMVGMIRVLIVGLYNFLLN